MSVLANALVVTAVLFVSARSAHAQSFFRSNVLADRCAVLNEWTSQLSSRNLASARWQDLPSLTAPVFRAGVFTKYFGKSYLDLDDTDRVAVHTALKRCFGDWRAFGLVAAFGYSSSPMSLDWKRAVAEDERAGQGQSTSSGAPQSSATSESRGGVRNPVLLENSEWIVYLASCGRFSTIAQIVARKPPEYVFSDQNPEYWSFLEAAVFPALSQRCPGSERFVVSNYLAGIHVLPDVLTESPNAPTNHMERAISEFVVTRDGGGYKYSRPSFVESSLAQIRFTRQKNLIAAQAKVQMEESARQTAIEDVRLAAAARAQARQQAVARLNAKTDSASKWYRGMMLAKGVSRVEFLRQLGPLALEVLPPVGLPNTAGFAAMVSEAASGAGLTLSGTSKATLEVSFEKRNRRFTASNSQHGGGTQDYSILAAQAVVRVPAIVRRPSGFLASEVSVAFGSAISLRREDEFTLQDVAAVLKTCLAGLSNEAGRISSPAATDEEWMDLLTAYEGSVAHQAKAFSDKLTRLPKDRDPLSGLDRIGRIDQMLSAGLGAIERIATVTPMEALISTIGTLKPGTQAALRKNQPPPKDVVSNWTRELTARGIAVAPQNIPAAFLPVLVHRFGAASLTAVQLGEWAAGPTVIVSQAVIFEPNCIVETPTQQMRVECATAAATVVHSNAYSADAFLEGAQKSMDALLAKIDAAPRPSTPEPALLPSEPYTVEVAYQRLNRRRPQGELMPLIYQLAVGRAFVAGVEKASGEFKVIAIPTVTQVQDMTRGRQWQGVSAEVIADMLRKRFDAYSFLERNYGIRVDDPLGYANNASRAPILAFDVEPKAQY